MQSNHNSRSRCEEAMRLITLARGMLAGESDNLAVTYLDLAFGVLSESSEIEGSGGLSISTNAAEVRV